MADHPGRDDDEMPPFPYGDDAASPLDSPDSSAASARPENLSDLFAGKGDSVPSAGDTSGRFNKSADAQASAINSLTEAVTALSASEKQGGESPDSPKKIAPQQDSMLQSLYEGMTGNLLGVAPQQQQQQLIQASAKPNIDLTAVTAGLDKVREAISAGLDRVYSAITAKDDGSSPSDEPSATSTAEAMASPSDEPSAAGSTETSQPEARSSNDPEPFASSGIVPGEKTGEDKVPSALTEGEFVMRPEAVKAHGVDKLEEMNNTLQKPESQSKDESVYLAEPQKHRTGGEVKGFSIGGYIGGRARAASRGAYMAGGTYGAYEAATRSNEAPQRPNAIGGSMVSAAMQGGANGGGLTGAAMAAVVAGFKAVGESANAAAEQLKGYSASIATANANAKNKQIIGDIRRAGVVGDAVGKHVEHTSNISQSNQNFEAALMTAGLAILNPLLELLTPVIEMVNEFLGNQVAEFVNMLANLLEAAGEIIDWLNGPMAGVPEWIGKTAGDMRTARDGIKTLVKQGAKDEVGMDIDQWMTQFLNGHGMGDESQASTLGLTARERRAHRWNKGKDLPPGQKA